MHQKDQMQSVIQTYNNYKEHENMGMYEDIKEGVDPTIEIDGYPFYPEEITGNESYNRRELNRQSILGGTEFITRGKYVCRDFNFTTMIYIPDGHPEKYDDIFEEMVSKKCEVISPYMGGKFYAEVIIQKTAPEASPNHLELDIQVKEIPDATKSNIPKDEFTKPADKLVQEQSKLVEDYSIKKTLLEVYKTDEENFVPYTPLSGDSDEEEETTEETEEEESTEEEDEEDSLTKGFSLHQGEILETYYYNQFTNVDYDSDYEDINDSGSLSIPEQVDLARFYKGVRLAFQTDYEEYGHALVWEGYHHFIGFIIEETFNEDGMELKLTGMTKLLEQKYEFDFSQMKISEILVEMIKTAGLKPEVDPTGLDDKVIDYTNVSSDSSDDDDSVYSGDVPADVAELAKKICKGKSGCMAKIKAIWAWEVENVHYSWYTNSPTNGWDPSKCLANRSHINCCDTACLTVHLLRAVGVKANYVYNSAHCWTVAYCGSQKIYMDKTSDSPPRGVISGLGQVWRNMTGTEGEKAYGGYG